MSYRTGRRSFPLGFIIKAIVVIAILLGILLLVNHCTGGMFIHKIDKSLPDIQAAPWEVTTPTHLYYAKDVTDGSSTVVLDNWYENLDGKWIKHSGELVLEKRLYGRIDVKRR